MFENLSTGSGVGLQSRSAFTVRETLGEHIAFLLLFIYMYRLNKVSFKLTLSSFLLGEQYTAFVKQNVYFSSSVCVGGCPLENASRRSMGSSEMKLEGLCLGAGNWHQQGWGVGRRVMCAGGGGCWSGCGSCARVTSLEERSL